MAVLKDRSREDFLLAQFQNSQKLVHYRNDKIYCPTKNVRNQTSVQRRYLYFLFDRNSCNSSHSFTIWLGFILCSIWYVVRRTVSLHFYNSQIFGNFEILFVESLYDSYFQRSHTMIIFGCASIWYKTRCWCNSERLCYFCCRNQGWACPGTAWLCPSARRKIIWNYRTLPRHWIKNNSKLQDSAQIPEKYFEILGHCPGTCEFLIMPLVTSLKSYF